MRILVTEGIVLLAISIVSFIEGVRLTFRERDPNRVYDVLGPGIYIVILSLGLMVIGIVYLIVNYRKSISGYKMIEKVPVNRELRTKVISMIVIFVFYNFLLGITGYLVSTAVFYLLEFRVVGIKSWKKNIILTIVLTIVCYIIFEKYCGMVFPRGIFGF